MHNAPPIQTCPFHSAPAADAGPSLAQPPHLQSPLNQEAHAPTLQSGAATPMEPANVATAATARAASAQDATAQDATTRIAIKPTTAASTRAWPPGPPAGLTGWGLLRRMSRDLLGALAEWQQQYGDLVHLRIWHEHEVVVSDPALVRELLVAQHEGLVRWERGIEVFSRIHGQSVLIAEGAAWRKQRHALQPAFAPKAVQAFVPAVVDAAEAAMRDWPPADTPSPSPFPIESALTSLAMDVIVRMLFSSSIGDEARAAEQAVHTLSVAANSEFYWPMSWPDSMPWKRAKREAMACLRTLIDRQLDARLAQPAAGRPDDMLSRLLQLQHSDPGTWTRQAVHDECMTAFLAGHETVAASLSWWSACMAAHPAIQQQAADEVERLLRGRAPDAADLPGLRLLTQTLQETMRLYPAAPLLISRRTTRAMTLGRWQLPARTMIAIPVQQMHHDARWFEQPQAFRPERFAPGAPEIPRGAYLPFGTGPRVCLGQHLAMTEMLVVAALLLQRYELVMPAGQDLPRPALNVTLRPEQPLQLQLRPRLRSQR